LYPSVKKPSRCLTDGFLLKVTTLALVLTTGLLSFQLIELKSIEFSYPKRNKTTTIELKAENFGKFTKEWRGEDYYFYGESKDKIICSVLYFKLNKDEQKLMVEPFGGMITPGIPMLYFTENSQLKKYEKNPSGWGTMTDDFMGRQFDIEDYEGIKIKQKHMNAYAMCDKDLFVNVHLSKTSYTVEDSTAMRAILTSLIKKK
jgi:hypothetical protein